MRVWANRVAKLWFLGLIGTFSNLIGGHELLGVFELFYIFGLLWLGEIYYMFKQSGSIRRSGQIFGQSLMQLMGIPTIYIKYRFRLPSAGNYEEEVHYRLPFKGEWYVANGGIDKENSHSWEICNQRYAYDFVKVNTNEETYIGNRTNLESYYCYRQEVLAPADGVVVEVKDEYIDTKIPEKAEALCEAADIRGNYIVIRHSKNEYSVIAHLLKDSIRVKCGNIVEQGDVIALCGNSGNTSEPHIHFQVQRGESFYSSPGCPVAFKHIAIDSRQQEGDKIYIKRDTLVQNQDI